VRLSVFYRRKRRRWRVLAFPGSVVVVVVVVVVVDFIASKPFDESLTAGNYTLAFLFRKFDQHHLSPLIIILILGGGRCTASDTVFRKHVHAYFNQARNIERRFIYIHNPSVVITFQAIQNFPQG
jgi:hypothetical protein